MLVINDIDFDKVIFSEASREVVVHNSQECKLTNL